MNRKQIVDILSIPLILLFVYAGGSKLVNLNSSYLEMNNQPFPNWTTPYLVWGISLTELLIASLLFFDRTKKAGLWSSLIIMSIFTFYIGAILLGSFKKVPCSCGGVIKQLGWNNHLYFNLFFVLISLTGLILLKKQKGSNNYQPAQKVALS